MILYVNGDSHSHGCGLPAHQRYSNIVGKELGFTVVNNAQMGASNASILRTTKQYFDNGNVPDFVIIGWSTWEREEWFFQNQYYNVNASGHDKLPEELQELYNIIYNGTQEQIQQLINSDGPNSFVKWNTTFWGRIISNKVPHIIVRS